METWPLDLACGPVHVSQLAERGISRQQVRDLLTAGVIRRIVRAVYVASVVPDTIELRAAALGLVVPTTAVVVDRTAAWLHGVEILPRGMGDDLPPVQMYQREGTRIRRGGVDGGRRTLGDDDVMIVNGIQVTTPLRTALDLGRLLWRFDALAALDGFARAGVSLRSLEASLPRFRGARGVVQLRSLVPLVDPRAESPAESALRLHWYDAGLPRPEVQWWIERDGVPVFRLDLALPDEGYAVEYDGEAFHSSDEDRDADDSRRLWIARERQYHFEVFTRSDIYVPGGDTWVRLRAGRRTARLRRGLSPYV